MAYWLFKSEPSTFSLEDLKHRPNQCEHWDGVRNYQARNYLRDQIAVGDLILFYHSNCKEPGIVGTARVIKGSAPDTTALDPKSPHFDPKSTKEKPIWVWVTVQYRSTFKNLITLQAIKQHPVLSHMKVAAKGNRLSITPVSETEWKMIQSMTNDTE